MAKIIIQRKEIIVEAILNYEEIRAIVTLIGKTSPAQRIEDFELSCKESDLIVKIYDDFDAAVCSLNKNTTHEKIKTEREG